MLNDVLLARIGDACGTRVLELGCGNGYFARLLLDRHSGRPPARMVLLDASEEMLQLAKRGLSGHEVELVQHDVRRPLPFDDGAFDLVLATFVFNEIPSRQVAKACAEVRRVMGRGGRLLATVVHPELIHDLDRRGRLKPAGRGVLTMPSADGLRLPVTQTSEAAYRRALEDAGFAVELTALHASEAVLNERPALGRLSNVPLALLLDAGP
ncbi:MAG: class I SAM-dependent methyltransferase [Planctomycetota bacterium]|nr:class I SAM-dependent methyltransferase [Planctomycetota bacterium]